MTEPQTRQLPAHELVMSELMMPNTANFSGNVHGGELLRLLDQVAYSAPAAIAGTIALPCLWTKYCLKSRFTWANW